jgi:copper chaperone CopZ
MHCEHCERAVKEEVGAVTGVETVDVDLATKVVTVRGAVIDDAAVRTAISEAGYDAA